MAKSNKERQATYQARQRENANLVEALKAEVSYLRTTLDIITSGLEEAKETIRYLTKQNESLLKDHLLCEKRRKARKNKRIADKFE